MAYDTYFLMQEKDVAGYVQAKLSLFEDPAPVLCREIGDGNLNYVFRVWQPATGKSVIAKQAGPELRIAKSLHASIDRGRIESEILKIQESCAPGSVPHVYLYDPVMKVILEQEMTGHKMMRTALLEHETFPKFADEITTFLVNSLLKTTDVCREHKAKKEDVRRFLNPMLCEITEDLVYSEPYLNYNNRNNVYPPNAGFIAREVYGDAALRLEAAKLKFAFMNNAQSLIHGDLHTGSIFISPEHTFVFDPEFCCYAPMGYDVGNILANLFFAWCNGDATMPEGPEKRKFCGWCLTTICEIVDGFFAKFTLCWKENVRDEMAKTPGFEEWYMAGVAADTAGVMGLECIRRVVGLANVRDLTSIENEAARTRAERIVITLAKDCILRRGAFLSGGDYRAAMQRAIAAYPPEQNG